MTYRQPFDSLRSLRVNPSTAIEDGAKSSPSEEMYRLVRPDRGKDKIMSFEDVFNKEGFIACVPYSLEIKEHPELNIFPLNILFVKYSVKDGKNVMVKALYEPVFESYKRKGNKCSLKYHNAYGGNDWLVIEYDLSKKNYTGEKFVNGKSIVQAFGPEWKMFFVHLTMVGLFNGERCVFEEIA